MGAQEQIAQVNAGFTAAFAAGDAAGVAACYSDDGWFMVPGAGTFKGRNALTTGFQGLIDSGLTSVILKTEELYDLGETAIEVGEYTLYAGNEVAAGGRFIVHWQNIGGKWFIHRDMINSPQA